MPVDLRQPSAGPELSTPDTHKVVHIILVPLDVAVAEVSGGTVSATGLDIVSRHTGTHDSDRRRGVRGQAVAPRR